MAQALQPIFEAYAKFGNPKADGKAITLSNADKWMKDAGILDGKQVTTTDTGIEFKKYKSKALDFKTFQQYVESLAKTKKLEPKDLIDKLLKSSAPAVAGTTGADKSAAVDRLTDTTKYTGTHKERFDAEGKGKGLEGRTDGNADNDGYVQGYKNKGTKK